MGNGLKLLLAAIFAAVAAYMKELVAPMLVLLIVMLLDYISGVSAAFVQHELSSRVGLIDKNKKVGYLMIVAVGMALDYLISLLGDKFGVEMQNIYFVGLLVIVWLIINECISILENTDEMGLPVPPFIRSLLKRLKRHTEETAGEDASPEDM